MNNFHLMHIIAISILMLTSSLSSNNTGVDRAQPEKELYIPAKIAKVPDGNDYNNDQSEFCFKHSLQSENLALFWHAEYGDDPMSNPDSSRRFDPERALEECERFYDYYVEELKMVQKGNSLTDKYKMLIIVFGGDEGTAFGGGEEEKVGILWTPAVRINREPFGALAHEMAHCFQYLSRIDCGTGPMGPIMEMSAQYMLWQVYPDWMTFENYHLEAFMNGTHYAFLHPENMYHSPYVLEYWSEKHGKEFFGKLSRETQEGEDPVATYKRINSLSQAEFNDEIYDASRRFITWDLKRVEKEARQYANQHKSILADIGDGWFRIDSSRCPQNYGYNGIKLIVPAPGTEITVHFKGMAGAKGYSAVNTDKAGWRYGFVASLKNGNRKYGNMFNSTSGTATFKIPKNTTHLWLVVSGSPSEHWPVQMRWGRRKPNDLKDEQWPYKIRLVGTAIDTSAVDII